MKSFKLLTAATLAIITLIAAPTHAQPDSRCRVFAKQFGEGPDQLDTMELARLRTCVTNELDRKLAKDRIAAPAPAAKPSPRPVPSAEPRTGTPKTVPQ